MEAAAVLYFALVADASGGTAGTARAWLPATRAQRGAGGGECRVRARSLRALSPSALRPPLHTLASLLFRAAPRFRSIAAMSAQFSTRECLALCPQSARTPLTPVPHPPPTLCNSSHLPQARSAPPTPSVRSHNLLDSFYPDRIAKDARIADLACPLPLTCSLANPLDNPAQSTASSSSRTARSSRPSTMSPSLPTRTRPSST